MSLVILPQDSRGGSFLDSTERSLSIFWWHPRPMDYRRELFRLMQERHRPRFFFLARNDAYAVANAMFSRRGIVQVSLLPRAMTWQDARAVWKAAGEVDVFVTSFLGNLYTVIGAVAARRAGRPVVVWEETQWFPPTLSGRLRRRLWRWLAGLADSYFVLGQTQRRVLRELGVDDARIFVANEYPGVVYGRVEPRRVPLPLPDGDRLVLYVGRFVEFKGIKYLLQAFARIQAHHADTWLVLAGDGPELGAMKTLAQELGLERVHFLGFVSDPAQKSFLFRRASLLVVPSVRVRSGSEGGPLVVLEAMSAGLPVLGTTALGSSTELIVDGATGRVVPEQDAVAFATAMEEMLARPLSRLRVERHFASMRDHHHQAEQLERAIAFASGRDHGARA